MISGRASSVLDHLQAGHALKNAIPRDQREPVIERRSCDPEIVLSHLERDLRLEPPAEDGQIPPEREPLITAEESERFPGRRSDGVFTHSA